ncbi:MAG: ABC transporter permease [Eubacteriales bacterium]|nr:ABC transporter permease [Eubacteriales bacterium]MDD3073648.1 ABC transporter permease [Eubacteriales bacterium]MDD4078817.1 ABC transporter permease [Eubacteriales bacterium]MDD4769493.1 ABC transporter permease [Eubacteriales bacterium]
MALSPNLFKPIDKSDVQAEEARPSITYWQDAWRRLKKNPLAMASLIFIALLLLVAIVGPFFSPYSYSDQDFTQINLKPCGAHPFGTDNLGRDILVRTLYGARISLSVGFVAAITTFVIGVLFGGISGLIGGWVDNLMMRFVDVMYSIPFLLWVIMLIVLLDPEGSKGVSLFSIFLALGIIYWLPMARIVRGQILSLKEQEFVLAARTIGAPKRKILLQHLLPNAMGPIIVTATISIPEAIFTESFLSFIGLGVSAPMASWGMLASDALPALKSFPHLLVFPAISICITLLAFNFIGDGLRDALDPKMRK